MVVVDRLAANVGVLARRQVESFDGAQLLEDLERPEDRRATDAEMPGAGLGDELGRGEVAVVVGDECGE